MRHFRLLGMVVFAAAWCLPATVDAAACSASARYIKAEAKDTKGFKQAVTLGVNASGAAHGLVVYTITYKDKAGASQTKSTNSPYKFDPAAASEATLADGTTIREIPVIDDALLSPTACADATPCSITGVTVDKTSCFADK